MKLLILLIFFISLSHISTAYKVEGRRGSDNIVNRTNELAEYEFVLAVITLKFQFYETLSLSGIINDREIQMLIRKLAPSDQRKLSELIGVSIGLNKTQREQFNVNTSQAGLLQRSRGKFGILLNTARTALERSMVDRRVFLSQTSQSGCLVGCYCGYSCRSKLRNHYSLLTHNRGGVFQSTPRINLEEQTESIR